jgi:SAM-dependent methyltransferase
VLHTIALPPLRPEAQAARRLRSLLADAGYDAGAVNRALRPLGADSGDGAPLVDRRELPVHRRRLEGRDDALAVLVRLFLLGDPVPAGAVEAAIGDASFLVELGVLRERDGDAEATVRLVPHDDLVLASDRDDAEAGRLHVPGVQRPSATLAHLTLRRPVRSALDVGTGLGIQALLLARHAGQVVATDVNERALAYAAFNAALNGVTTIELRHGSFLEPVAGERFDLAVSNPPYVVSPASELVFRDGDLAGDGVSEHVVRALPSVLARQGLATVMVSWVSHKEDVCAEPRAWVEGSGCDAIIVHTSSEDALTTAAAWNRDERDDPDAYAQRLDEWIAYYRQEGIEAIAYGAIVLRRTGRTPWVQELRLPPGRLAPASAHLERVLAAKDARTAGLWDRLPDVHLALAPAAGVELTHRFADGAWQAESPVLALADGLGFRAELDGATLAIVQRLDGSRPLADVLREVAADSGRDAGRVTEAGVALARRLLELGFATVQDIDRYGTTP